MQVHAGQTVVVNPGDDLQAAVAHASAGDTIQLVAGTYNLTASIAGKSGITILGDPLGQTTLKAGSGVSAFFQLANASDMRLARMTLDGDGGHAAYGITASNGSGHTLEHLHIRNLSGTGPIAPMGIYFSTNVKQSAIRNNTFDTIGVDSFWGAGVRLADGSSHNTVEHNVINHVGRGGILVNDQSTHITIRHNTITRIGVNSPQDANGEITPRLGIELWNGGNDSLIERNTVDHYISVDASSRVAVRHNTLQRITGVHTRAYTGLEIVGGPGKPSSDVIFSHNRLVATADPNQPSTDLGMSISGNGIVEHVLFDRNTIDGAGTWGVQVQGADAANTSGVKRRLYFLANTFTRTQDGNPGPYGVQGHAVRLNGDHGLIHDIVLADNTITDNAGVAFQLQGSGNITDVRWTNNTASGNQPNVAPLDDVGNPDHPDGIIIELETVAEGIHLKVKFADDRAVHHALWDVGFGSPLLGEQILAPMLDVGSMEVTVVVWDAQGNADHARFTVSMPEPSVGAMMMGGLLLVRGRGVGRSAPDR